MTLHRKAVLAAVVATVVATVVSGCGGGRAHPTSRAASATSAPTLEVGPPLATYVDSDRLVLSIDGVAQPGHWGGASSFGHGLVLAFGNDLGTVGVFVHGARIATLRHVWNGIVMASPDARTIAWMDVVDTSVHLVAATVGRDAVHELGSLPLDAAVVVPDSEGSERVMKVDDDHTVTYGGVTGGYSWRPGGQPKVANVSELLTRAAGYPNTEAPAEVNFAGTWGAWPSTSTGRSPHDEDTTLAAVTVQRPHRPASRVTFAMPRGEGVQWIFWEDDTNLVAAVSRTAPVPGSAIEADGYVRCNVVDHHCEYAPIPGGH